MWTPSETIVNPTSHDVTTGHNITNQNNHQNKTKRVCRRTNEVGDTGSAVYGKVGLGSKQPSTAAIDNRDTGISKHLDTD
jgi:hypothetical protein